MNLKVAIGALLLTTLAMYVVDDRFDRLESIVLGLNERINVELKKTIPWAPEGVEFSMDTTLGGDHFDAFNVDWTHTSLEAFMAGAPVNHFMHMEFTDADVWLNWDAAHISWRLDEDAPPEEISTMFGEGNERWMDAEPVVR